MRRLESLNIFCAGAARAVVMRRALDFQREHHLPIVEHYGAVGAMKARIVAGELADVIVLTAGLIDELIERGLVVAGSRSDLGRVGTAIAVRAGVALPDVCNADALRASLLIATKIVCPDPAVATAGKVLLEVIRILGIAEQIAPKLEFAASGNEAIIRIAQGIDTLELGVMQVSEIIAGTGVTLAGTLPRILQSKTLYSAGLAARSVHPDRSRDFIEQLTGVEAHVALLAAGFEVD